MPSRCTSGVAIGSGTLLGHFRVANSADRVFAPRDLLHFFEELVAHHGDAAVAGAEEFLAAVGDRALANPRDNVLIDDVTRKSSALGILDRAVPCRNALLDVTDRDPIGTREKNQQMFSVFSSSTGMRHSKWLPR